uniref:F-box associated beta-propeller type 1 domain-containing protein n=1 Tax=Opuntia streptacantha TaxID=393608 RepID=A0A7C9CTK0_OPUST
MILLVMIVGCTHSFYGGAESFGELDCLQMFVNVYSLKSGSWKEDECLSYDTAIYYVTPGVFVDGCIHCLTVTYTDHKPCIVAFNLRDEKFSEVPLPSSAVINKSRSCRLAVVDGRLCIFNGTRTDVWVMKQYGVNADPWCKLTIDDPEADIIHPLCMLWGKKKSCMRRMLS